MNYLVSHQGQEQGPYSLREIADLVRSKKLELFDYLFDEQQNDWVMLMEFEPLTQLLRAHKPPPPQAAKRSPDATPKEEVQEAVVDPAPVKARPVSPHAITEWFCLKGEHRFGPFGYPDVVRMLQQKVIFPFDFIWHAGLPDWVRIAELQEFQSDYIRDFYSQAGKKNDVFIPRKFKRKKYNGRVIIHDNLSLWKAEGFEISKGGVGVTMKNSLVVPGQQVHAHFSSYEDWPAFNAICEVVSKKFVKDGSPVEYGLRFLSLSQETQEEFFKKVS